MSRVGESRFKSGKVASVGEAFGSTGSGQQWAEDVEILREFDKTVDLGEVEEAFSQAIGSPKNIVNGKITPTGESKEPTL